MELAEVIGHLAELRRFPIEPLGGEAPSEALIVGNGLAGDRAYEIYDAETGEPLTPSTAPLLLSYSARYQETPVGQDLAAWARVRSPAGKDFLLSDTEWAAEMSQSIGRRVCVRPRAAASGAPLHLLSRRTLRLAERTYGGPLEPVRLRANFLVEITEGKAFQEEEWIGKRIRIGDALLEIVGLSSGCLVTAFRPETARGDLDMLSGLVQVRGHIGVSVRAVSGHRVRVADSLILVD